MTIYRRLIRRTQLDCTVLIPIVTEGKAVSSRDPSVTDSVLNASLSRISDEFKLTLKMMDQVHASSAE